jgi:hypothetical protein
MFIAAECLYYKEKDDTYETKRAFSSSFKRDIVYVGSISE